MSKKIRLPIFPAMQCDADCGDCCTSFFVSELEFQRLRRHVEKADIKPRFDEGDPYRCPFYQAGSCAVYVERPAVCRVMGHVEQLACSRGYNTNVEPGPVTEYMVSLGTPVRLMHEFLPEGTADLDAIRTWTAAGNPEHLKSIPGRTR